MPFFVSTTMRSSMCALRKGVVRYGSRRLAFARLAPHDRLHPGDRQDHRHQDHAAAWQFHMAGPGHRHL
jgi:hypothetical protein